MTDDELKAIEERAEAASGERWVPKHIKTAVLAYATGENEYVHEVLALNPVEVVATIRFPRSQMKQADANLEFIAAARSDVPALAAEIRKLKALLREVEWDGSGPGQDFATCPSCRGADPSDPPSRETAPGHRPDCALAAAIR